MYSVLHNAGYLDDISELFEYSQDIVVDSNDIISLLLCFAWLSLAENCLALISTNCNEKI